MTALWRPAVAAGAPPGGDEDDPDVVYLKCPDADEAAPVTDSAFPRRMGRGSLAARPRAGRQVPMPRSLFTTAFAATTVMALAGCPKDPDFIECRDNDSCYEGGQCTLNPATGHKFCSYEDADCPSGWRWSDNDVEESISGMCVAEETPIIDAGVDSSIDAPIDASFIDSGPGGPCDTGLVVFISDRQGNPDLYMMQAEGTGVMEVSVATTALERYPQWSPDGTRIAFETDATGNKEIFVVDVDGSNLVNVTNSSGAEGDRFEWSPDSSKIVFDSNRDGNLEIYVVDADGMNRTRLTTNTTTDFDPHWSPSGAQIAFVSQRDGNQEIYVMNADGSSQTNLTANASSDTAPHWSPNGQKIAFLSTRGAPAQYNIWSMDANGANQTNLTNDATIERAVFAWSPDSTRIAYQVAGGSDDDISIMNANGTGKASVVDDDAQDQLLGWSPDGTRLYFVSERDGNKEIYTILPNGTDPQNKTSNAANEYEAHWIVCP